MAKKNKHQGSGSGHQKQRTPTNNSPTTGVRHQVPPVVSVPPPPGTYDPSLDAALGQVNRGFYDQYADFVRDFGATGQGGRAFNDYQIGVGDIERQVAEGRADLGTARTRGQQDFADQFSDIRRDRDRGQQDFATTIAGIARQFQQQATQQGQSLSAAGTASGGALMQALKRRQENQQLTEQPVRTAFDRFMQDSTTAETRLGEQQNRYFADLDTQEERQFGMDPNLIGGAAGRALAGLGLNYGRQQEDANTGLERARRENTQYGIDTQTQRLYQATQAGYVTPKIPAVPPSHGGGTNSGAPAPRKPSPYVPNPDFHFGQPLRPKRKRK